MMTRRGTTLGTETTMQLDTPGATVKGPAATFTGDVYVTPVHARSHPRS
jgi:hypothetical protein